MKTLKKTLKLLSDKSNYLVDEINDTRHAQAVRNEYSRLFAQNELAIWELEHQEKLSTPNDLLGRYFTKNFNELNELFVDLVEFAISCNIKRMGADQLYNIVYSNTEKKLIPESTYNVIAFMPSFFSEDDCNRAIKKFGDRILKIQYF